MVTSSEDHLRMVDLVAMDKWFTIIVCMHLMEVILKLQLMKACGRQASEKALGHLHGLMAASIKALGAMICDWKEK